MPRPFTRTSLAAALVLAAPLATPLAAGAQQRPLVTEDPETIGAGRILIEAGFDYGRGVEYPASGLTGQLVRVPLVGVSIGISSIAELQIDGGLFDRLSITERRPAPLTGLMSATGDHTSDVDDMVVATKIRLVPEGVGRPSFGLRLATKLPNASNESGLGLDTMDFYATVLAAKTVRSVRAVANIGMAILPDPVQGNRQEDAVAYGASLARALTPAAEVVAEVNGRLTLGDGDPAPGTESRGTARVGARYTIGSWRGDAAVLVGLTSRDPGVGVTAGFTYVFNAFRIP